MGASPVADHRPWPRVVVDEARWLALRERLATADWALLGLWGDRSAAAASVLALRDESEAAGGRQLVRLPRAALPAARGVRPAGAMRLERMIPDLFGLAPTAPTTRGPGSITANGR